MATSGKALLDTLYFSVRGRSFSFDPCTDTDGSRINHTALADYLSSEELAGLT